MEILQVRMSNYSSINTAMPSSEWTLAMVAGLWLFYLLVSISITLCAPHARYLRAQPWAGLQGKKTWLSEYRASIASLFHGRKMILEGYSKYSQRNRIFALPQLGGAPWAVIPPHKIRELLQKRDDEIDHRPVIFDIVAMYWTGDQDISSVNPIHLDIVRHQLTRKLRHFTHDIHAELVLGFENQWHARKDEWTTISASESCTKIVSRAANRVFTGAELCRNDTFLEHTRQFAQGIFLFGPLIRMMPSWLRPLLAPILVAWNRRHLAVCKRIAMPVIQQRLDEVRSGKSIFAHNDALQWFVQSAVESGKPEEREPDKLCRRLIRLNALAIHSTSTTIAATLLDLYNSLRAEEFVEGLRSECHSVLQKHGTWTKEALNELIRVDSTIKESMRVSSVGMISLLREVVKDGGVDLGQDMQIPKGVRVAVPAVGMHGDSTYYHNPSEFDAFRFARSREVLDENGKVLEQKNQALVTTGDSFVAWGHGRHACPGRFFASQEMKLMLANIVMNYDVRTCGPRPPKIELATFSAPSPKAMLQVRLRR